MLYYAQVIDSTMLPALTQISATQANPTETTKNAIKRLLDYAHTYKNAYVRLGLGFGLGN